MSAKYRLVEQNLAAVAKRAVAEVPKPLEQLSEHDMERKLCIGTVMTSALTYLTRSFIENGFQWLLPVVFSPVTDPLWPDPEASLEQRIKVNIYGVTVQTTSSMIVHKMVACSLAHPKLFTLSPNVRVERRERASTGRHAYEFTQLDFEVRDATSNEIRLLVEDTICRLVESLKSHCRDALISLGRYDSLRIPRRPFPVYDSQTLEAEFGEDWQAKLPYVHPDPVWVVNIPREFYDFEDADHGKWDNYDLVLPRYGEVLSGARREWEHGKMASKMKRDGVRRELYKVLLRLAHEGRLQPSAGAGIGIERLVSWLVQAKHIGDAQLFPKIPGIVYDL
jgi:asparaginyl-tRNA synthetase